MRWGRLNMGYGYWKRIGAVDSKWKMIKRCYKIVMTDIDCD